MEKKLEIGTVVDVMAGETVCWIGVLAGYNGGFAVVREGKRYDEVPAERIMEHDESSW